MCFFSATHMKTWVTFSSHHFVSTLCYIPTWTMWFIACRDFYAASGVKGSCRSLNTKVEIRSDDLNDVYYIRSWCQRHKWKRTFWTKKSLLVPVSEWVADFQWYWWTHFAPMSPFLIFQSLLRWLFVFHSMKKEQTKFHVATVSQHFQLLSGFSHFDPWQTRRGIVTMSARRFQSHAFVKRVAALKLWPLKNFPTWLYWSLETHIFWWIPIR